MEFRVGEHDGPFWGTQPLWEALRGYHVHSVDRAEATLRSLPHPLYGEISDIDDWYEPGWALYSWQPPVERQAQPARGAGVSTFARRLMALERRRMRRSTPLGGLHGQRRKGAYGVG